MHPQEALDQLKAAPNDVFLRRFVISRMGEMEPEDFDQLCAGAIQEAPHAFQALLFESALSHERFTGIAVRFEEEADREALAEATPLPLIRATLLEEEASHTPWLGLLDQARETLTPLPRTIARGLPPPVDPDVARAVLCPAATLPEAFAERFGVGKPAPAELPGPDEVVRMGLDALARMGLSAEEEQRHQAALSPVNLLRKWHMEVRVRQGGLDYALSGGQTSYGKGLRLPQARASLVMEMVERASSYASITDDGPLGYTTPMGLVRGSYNELADAGRIALRPDSLRLDTPSDHLSLLWVLGRDAGGGEILLPAQLIFLFCNLDEPELATGHDSTGLGAGVTMAQARLQGVCETLERDAAALAVHDPSRCFLPVSDDPELATHLDALRQAGVQPILEDITSPFGVPAYRCVVRHQDGEEVSWATACHPSGPRAAVSALLETMYPFPGGEPSAQPPEGLAERRIEDLPDHSTGDPEQDLALLEEVLTKSGHPPVYCDLTREDLALPVVRCLIPGLENGQERRVGARLYGAILRSLDAD